MRMIRLALFDYSKTIIKGSGNRTIANFMGKGEKFDEIFEKFVSNKISDKEFITSVTKLWKDFDLERLPEIIKNIELSPNIEEVIKQLKNMKIKLALVSHIPQQLADLYKEWGFDYIYGNECEVKNGKFTGKVLKMNPDKGYTVKNLCDRLGIRPNECIAVGDSRADIEMFKVVGYGNSFAYHRNPNWISRMPKKQSFFVHNTNEEVKKYAKYHIKDFKEIIEIVKKMNEEDIKTIFKKRVEIFEKAWKEFYKGTPKPKTDKEDIEQQREFSKFLKDKYGLNFEFKE